MSAPHGEKELGEAVRHLRDGGVVLLPTDTLYGLGADVFSVPALKRVFSIKGRPPHLALPVLVSGWGQVGLVARDVPESGRMLARRFWPGALTLVLSRRDCVPDLVTGGRDTVAVRMPGHPVPLALADKLGGPITGTSANRSGEADPQTLAEVEAELGGRVDYIIRAGPAPKGTPSTVVDISTGTPRLLRQGAVPFPEVLQAWE
ncbi:MAG: L-threonylcarbamoyladenylate synthase [Dehalococcoidia bacterium]|nr:L-threonylcarbamoyladenylate synthase [Dehalococcoidia bacterium]